MDRIRPGVAPMVPFMFAALNQEMRKRGRNLEGLRFCFSGAAPLPADVLDEFQDRTGAIVVEGYGLSEASPVTHTNPPDGTARSGTIGLPLPGTDARIVDSASGQIVLPPGQVGELIIRGPQVMAGYLDDPEETAHVLRDGWLFTGDLARMEPDGFFRIVDRKKDMIISGGLNVYPGEVEEVLVSHASVRECAVVGMPHPMYGEQVAAYVVPAAGRTVNFAELQAYCRPRLAGYKIPRRIEIVDRLPTNFLGKVRRVELRARAA
jgi:long-chain acyl-CoA synthetase